MKYYLVGILGTGMSSLACFLKDLGNTVVGSDTDINYFTMDNLIKKKIKVLSFNKKNIKSTYVYIIGNAFNQSNIEVNEIMLNKYEYYYYHDFIGNVLDKDLICISGTHGKTTTALFLSQMLENNCSYIVGDGSGYGTRNTNYLVLEACEYKEHFLSYNSKISLITNIELDHPDYYKSINQLKKSFSKFANKTKILVLNNDEISTKYIKHNNIITFGFSKTSDYVISIVEENIDGYKLCIEDRKSQNFYSCNFPFFGKHLIYDFVGGYVISLIIGHYPNVNNLKLPKRRMTFYNYGNTTLIDDYAHHPTEIRCLYSSIIKTYPNQKINVIFQPHTYSRTIKFQNDFIDALKLFDMVYIENVFTSKREKIDLNNEKKVKLIFNEFEKFNEDVINNINKEKKEIWLFLGAGVVNKYIDRILNNNINK